MALIDCEECGHKVSDTAATCPSCGAPIEAGHVTPSHSETYLNCPFCRKPLHADAVTCGHCGAEKGYYNGYDVVSSKSVVVIFGVMLPIAVMFLMIIFEPPVIIAALIFFIMGTVLVKGAWQLFRGPRWWKTR
ncbi:MAG: zinc ribbon domain-containing protein [Candidatus Thiodiazotropha sp.]